MNESNLSECEEYSKNVFVRSELFNRIFTEREPVECSQKLGQILEGGEKVSKKELPHMALIGHAVNITKFKLLSVGALISERFVLSSAHSANPRAENEAKWVILGDLEHGTKSKNTLTNEIIQILIHPQYESDSLNYDIALYKLYEEVIFDAYMIPICLPQTDHRQENVLESHWDTQRFKEIDNEPMRKNSLRIIEENQCHNAFRSEDRVTSGIKYDSNVCATSHLERRDSCRDNSGKIRKFL